MKTANDLKQMTIDELQSQLVDLRKQQFGLRMKKANGALDKTHVVKLVRRTIARVKTMITEKTGMSDVK
ncbi:MAG: 50S ribosomal protein L29 [Legionellales bacterium]|nr:50S ribosomal protein L29 [Legionellales bacterium]